MLSNEVFALLDWPRKSSIWAFGSGTVPLFGNGTDFKAQCNERETSMTSYTVRKLNGGSASLGSERLGGFRGRIMAAGDPGYDDARCVWNRAVDKKPGLILQPTGVADVQTAVRLARDHDLLVAIKGGGHNIAGSGTSEGGLLIDLSAMRAVRVFPGERRVSVQGGALLGDVDHETQAFNLAVPFGINSTTGVGGLALGGGFGWLSRKFGHTVDNILAIDVVTPDGEFHHASATQDPDLFWALRGGSGNFGVVTSFDFRCHPVPAKFLSGPVVYDLKDGNTVMREFRRLAKILPDEATCWAVLRKAPPQPFLKESDHGRPAVVLAMCYAGDAAEGERVLAPLRAIGTPLGDGVGLNPYAGWQAAFDPLVVPPARNYWKSHDFMELSDAVLDRTIAATASLPDDQCEIFVAQLGGAASRVPSDAMAFPHRSHSFTMNVHGRWLDAAKDQACKTWVRDLYSAVAPYATGSVYVNFVPEVEDDRDIGPYGANQARLARVKRTVDPQNRFRTNINIQPAAS